MPANREDQRRLHRVRRLLARRHSGLKAYPTERKDDGLKACATESEDGGLKAYPTEHEDIGLKGCATGRRRPEVLGVPIDPVSTADVLRFVRERVEAKRPAQAVTVNAEFIVRARRDDRFREVLQEADLATPDSAGVLWALRRQGVQLDERVGGSDLIWSLSELAAERGFRVFLLGAGEGVAETAARRLEERFPRLQIAGAHPGGPAPELENHIVDLIRRAKTDILLVAFGAPEQDLWIARNLAKTGALFAMGVGGSVDYVAGVAKRAPAWMRERNLEWLWRLIRQPRRWKRIWALPRFVWLVWRDREASGESQD